jgi:uncharacterized membrane protein YdbT with pleckstrin-like domain
MGVVAPEVVEARLAVRWPSVASVPGVAKLGSSIQQAANTLFRGTLQLPTLLAIILVLPVTILAFFLAAAAWVLLMPFYFKKVLPFLMTRYTLTNRRLMIQKGWSLTPTAEVKLDELESVRVKEGSEQPFYQAADLEILSGCKVVLTLPGVPEYQSFKVNIENAYLAWGRKTPPKEQDHPATELAKIKV